MVETIQIKEMEYNVEAISFDNYKEIFDAIYPEVKKDCHTYFSMKDDKTYASDLYEKLVCFYYECEKRKLKVDFRFGTMYVKCQHFDEFKFTPSLGKITLMHKNTNVFLLGGYHTQFEKRISLKKLAIYMDEHDRAKYTTEFVHFSCLIQFLNPNHSKKTHNKNGNIFSLFFQQYQWNHGVLAWFL